ncbi:CMP-N-acetylneuraminate-beta-galactosamide-alpha-2,3-sialyltransferase 2-like [Thunnus albacares]|uniref:CMP-N-acetylneuraminate-beta-galactosamide- alpha-2,3-sialyltransferase 2-like n=1 Tax=Thunnus albacares TaxID=8236 RepID=UPI001CF6653E|nr:CMP-N-acetylneuraminate-beta-galactosamide-alpha-2,3-sialyltransferase 2-like [Thunnus albacares]
MLSTIGKIWVVVTLLCITAIGLLTRPSWSLSAFYRESSSCACRKCLTDGDPWFGELINGAPKPFLSRKYVTPEGAFNWWKYVQNEGRPYSFFNTTVHNLFQIFPPTPPFIESSPSRCITCAVVGNSGNLKGSHYGALIDYHDIVIRMNRGRTKGYEEDVGTKTTHHVMYPESAINLDNTTHLVLFPFKINDLLWLLRKFTPRENGPVKTIANKDLVMILNPGFMKYVHENWLGKKGRYPSTGFMTLALSMHMCDEVNVFGFGADRDGNWNHYFEVLRNKNFRTGPHSGTHEYDFIQQLHERKKIQLFRGW